jgi:3-methyladenine DNA glycosylase AlkD
MARERGGRDGYHDEVVAALREVGDPRYGAAVALDRGSSLEHLGIPFPVLRKRVKQGFSFYAMPEDEILSVWDQLWRTSPYGDVLFAALEYYAPRVRTSVGPGLWPVMRHWHERVDNWCHCDGLASLYSWILASRPGEVYPELQTWNGEQDAWLRRISIVSLIHYSGKNAVFFPLEHTLPLITACLDDDRAVVQKAVGWVLRELGNVYPTELRTYLETHLTRLRPIALTRAIERWSPAAKAEMRAVRAAASAKPRP